MANESFSRYFTYVLLFISLLSAFYSALYIFHMESESNKSSWKWEKKIEFQMEKLKTSTFQKIPQKRMAWGSLAMKDYDVKGVIALAQSLVWANSSYPFVAIVSKNLSEKMIHLLKLPNLRIEHIEFIDPIQIPSHIKMGWPHWELALNKLEFWNLDQYEKIVYIDADFIVLKNMDDLFEYPELTASTNLGVYCTLYEKPDTHQGGVNAGLVILQPSKQKYKEMIELFNNGNNWHNSDQGIIETYFASKTQLLPINWVTFSWCCNAPWFDRTTLKAVHFTRGTINYDKLAKQDIMADWDKNWPGKPNCDLDFYVHWKQMWHLAVDEP